MPRIRKKKPVPAPTWDKLSLAHKIYMNWMLHYYQLLYFQNPPLTSPGENGRPFAVILTPTFSLEIVPEAAPECTFSINTANTQEELDALDQSVLEKCRMIQDAIREGKQKPYFLACCGLAKTRACVCFYSYECPLHGSQCNGTHD